MSRRVWAPKEFNVARIELVFTSMIQFVEFNVEGYKLSKKVAPIPSDLLGLSEDSALKDRWRNAFRMFDGDSKFVVDIPGRNEKGEELPVKPLMKYGEVLLEKERQKIEQDFLYKVHGFGAVIFRDNEGKNCLSISMPTIDRFCPTVKRLKSD